MRRSTGFEWTDQGGSGRSRYYHTWISNKHFPQVLTLSLVLLAFVFPVGTTRAGALFGRPVHEALVTVVDEV